MSGNSGRVYLTKMGLLNIKKNRTMSVASVLVLLSCLTLVGLVILAALNLSAMYTKFSQRNVIMVFLKPSLTQGEISQLGLEIQAMDNVEECNFISSQEAFERIAGANGEDYALLHDLDVQFMPSSFEVVPEDMGRFGDLVTQLTALNGGIERVRHFQDLANQLEALKNALSIVGVVGIVLLLLVSLFIISSTIKTAMYSRQQEIKVMKSVGASTSFIRWPFFVEGIALGVCGSLAALLVVFVVYSALGRALDPLLGRLVSGFRLLSFGSQFPLLLPSFLGIGLLTGGGGSMLTISRYLKEQIYQSSELD
ncbi:MAG: permease-like cell division protein FtsX [Oscillospiraceae bacterium]|jgi:cell division transport system permease protein|nr:permease-like cell division protein FtsX [Oscillospiraceae bacterium]